MFTTRGGLQPTARLSFRRRQYVFPAAILLVYLAASGGAFHQISRQARLTFEQECRAMCSVMAADFLAEYVESTGPSDDIQQDIEAICKRDQRIDRLSFHARKADGNCYFIASSKTHLIGTPSHQEDVNVVETGEEVILTEIWGEQEFLDLTYPVQDDTGQTVGCIGLTINKQYRSSIALNAIYIAGSVLILFMMAGYYVSQQRRILAELKERHRAEEELKHHADALERSQHAAEVATRTKSEFLANMSHEIRTPMTAVLGFVDLLLESLQEKEDLEAARTIKRNGEHLLQIINDILDISKIEAGKLQIERIDCSPVKLLAESAALMKVRADAKGLPLIVEHAGPIPETIATDPTRLQQILTNLLGNAVKFTEVGSVRVVTRLLAGLGQEPKLRFDVVDTGIGITQEQADTLFQPFTQADTSTTRNFGGSGLGLTISKRLAEMLGGDITVTSVVGKGSTFNVTIATGPLDGIPLLDPTEAVPLGEPSAQPTVQLPAKLDARILLAEDGPDNQRLISHILRKAGADVEVAENGKVAVEKVLAVFPGWGRRHDDRKEPFDIILMDMQMPLMDGYEATKRLRQEGYTGPIVALTAHAMNHNRQECLDCGCDDYLTKPIDRSALITALAKHLATQPHSAETADQMNP